MQEIKKGKAMNPDFIQIAVREQRNFWVGTVRYR